MKTAYVVTSGEYSGYEIEAVFSSREKAQAYIDEGRDDRDEPDIEEWPIDRWEEIRGKTFWSVEIHEFGADGAYTKAWSHEGRVSEPADDPKIAMHEGLDKYARLQDGVIPHTVWESIPAKWWGVYGIEADTEERAIKIAAERVAREKAHLAGVG